MKLGKANYGGNYVKKNYWKLKDGESVYRILPPMGDLADSGRWSVFWNVHYGYYNSKGKMRPFQSPFSMNRKTKMVEVPDAAKERIEKLKAEFEKAKVSGDDVLYKKLNDLVGPRGKFNLQNNHHVNAMDLQGNIGTLELRHRAKLALDAEIKKLREQGVDPLSADDGRYFVFRRTGMGLDTSFQVTVYQETLDVAGVGKVKRDLVHKLTPEVIDRLEKEASKLDQLFKKPSAEEVARIVKEGPRAVDEILDKKENANSDLSDQEDPSIGTDEEYSTPSAVAMGVAATTPTPAAPVVMSVTDAKPLTVSVTATAPAPMVAAPVQAAAPKTTAQAVSEVSDTDFLASLGL